MPTQLHVSSKGFPKQRTPAGVNYLSADSLPVPSTNAKHTTLINVDPNFNGLSNNSDSESSQNVALHGKKRGRKMTELDKYFRESDWKIREWKNKLKNDKNLTAKEKQKYRNKISAQMSRVKKK